MVLADELSVAGYVERGDLVPICAAVKIVGDDLWASWRPGHPKLDLIRPVVAWLSQAVRNADPILPAAVVARQGKVATRERLTA